MNSNGVSTHHSHYEPTHQAQERLRDSSTHSPAVDTLSDKATRQAQETERSHNYADKNPSAVYVRSESRYEASYESSIKTSQSSQVNDRISSETASASILSFIENQLLRDVEDGASQNELASRIEAGLSGFLKGFEAAKEDLQALGALTPGVQADIEETYDTVLEGVESLKSTFLGEIAVEDGGKASVDSSSLSRPVNVEPPVGVQSQYYSYEAAQRNSFSFSVTTRDGDTVTVQSAALRSMFQENITVSQAGNGNGELSQFATSEDYQFNLQIDGELDDDEISALKDLLSQVNDLAENFFAGDVEAAFNDALALGYDDSEISSFALNLSQTSVQRVTAAYGGSSSQPSALADILKPVGHFARDLIEATHTAENFQNPEQLIGSIADVIDTARPEQGFKSFLERLMETLES